MKKLSVLIVDRDVVSRQKIAMILEQNPRLQIASTAATGEIAIAKIPLMHPDVMLLDMEIDGPGSLETLLKVRSKHPELPIIMMNQSGRTNAAMSLECIAQGASDVIFKPKSFKDAGNPDEVRKNLISKLLSLQKDLDKRNVPAIHKTAAPIRTAEKKVPVAIPSVAPKPEEQRFVKKLNILVGEADVNMRRVINDAFEESPDLRLSATASSGSNLLARVQQLNPDLVLLDMDLDGVGSLETLIELRARYPHLPILMLAGLGSPLTMESIAFGANDVIFKPSDHRAPDCKSKLLKNLRPKLEKLFGKSNPEVKSDHATYEVAHPQPKKHVAKLFIQGLKKIHVLAIGVSTGGPNALAEVLSGFPKDFALPILIVQHMPPHFTRTLAERLDHKCAISVREGKEGDEVLPGVAWIAPGDYHMTLKRDQNRIVLKMNQDPPVNSCRPAVDVLFKSVAHIYGSHALGLILTGMGQDGLVGCEDIRSQGGRILAQDEETSTVWGMPGFVARAGLAEKVLPLQHIATEIQRLVALSRQESLETQTPGEA